MAMSIVVGLVQRIRKQTFWDAPTALMMPAMLLWLLFSMAGIFAATLMC
jgi:hypothetical protein